MRVLLLSDEFPPIGGGAGISSHALARGLAARGVTVDVVTAGSRDGSDAELVWDGAAATEGLLTVHRVRGSRPGAPGAGLRGALSHVTRALPVVRRLLRAERYDVVHGFFSLGTGAMLPFLDLRGAPLVISLRGFDVAGRDPSPRTGEPSHRVPRALARWVLRRADRVIAGCESPGRRARRLVPELRYAVIPHGVDLARFRPRLRPARPHERIRCLAVARLVERKELGHLIRAIAMQEPGRVELEIVGGGPEEHRLRELAVALGVEESVRFAGPLDPSALARRYREADLFTLVTTDESCGNVFAEAMASGLPIVGSAGGGAAELVRDGRNGVLVPPGDPLALAAAIRRLAETPRARAEMGRRNRADAEERLGWERVTARHLAIYHGVQRRAPARQLLAEQPSSTW